MNKGKIPEAVKIKVTSELLNNFFLNSEHKFKVTKGITSDHKLKGVIQDYRDGSYYFLFSTNKSLEGQEYKDLIPTVQNL